MRYELSWGVLELDKDGQKDPLLLAIAGEEKRCKVFEEIWETDHFDPEGDDEGLAGLPMARERPRAGKSVFERAVILCPGPVLHLADKLEIFSIPLSSGTKTLEETERNQILKILSETRWRIEGRGGAAAILGLHPSTLRARMHKFGIHRREIKETD